jgi:hypothetical protein
MIYYFTTVNVLFSVKMIEPCVKCILKHENPHWEEIVTKYWCYICTPNQISIPPKSTITINAKCKPEKLSAIYQLQYTSRDHHNLCINRIVFKNNAYVKCTVTNNHLKDPAILKKDSVMFKMHFLLINV